VAYSLGLMLVMTWQALKVLLSCIVKFYNLSRIRAWAMTRSATVSSSAGLGSALAAPVGWLGARCRCLGVL